MAVNFPRVGVQQVNMADVYEASRRNREANPFLQALNAGASLLHDRNRDIAYRRAMTPEGQKLPTDRTSGEIALGVMKDVAGIPEATWRGIKKGVNALTNPFMEPESERITKGVLEAGVLPEGMSMLPAGEDESESPLALGGMSIGAPASSGEPGMATEKVSFPTSITRRKEFFAPEAAKNESLPAPKVSAGADFSAAYDIDPDRATFDWTREQDKLEKQRAISKEKEASKQRTQNLLGEVAAEFANLDPDDQAAWDASRGRWIDLDQNLANFIPAQASQNAWDQIQNQGGMGKNVAPKGEFAQRKYLEDQVKQLTFLSQAARAAGNSGKADFYANRALDLQATLDGGVGGGDNKTPEQWVAEYSDDIATLKKSTTKYRTADTSALFSELSKAIGSGATLDAVKSEISKQLEDERVAKGGERRYSDDELKEQVANYDDIATKLKEDRPKINGAVELLQRGINAGAAGMSSKTLQGDVLAEAEITRYISGDEWNQWRNKLRAAVGLAPSVRASLVADLVNALVSVFNKEVDAYNEALGTNKYKVKLSRLPLVDKFGKTNPPPGGGGKKDPLGIR